jgi:uncharacterized protein with NAD-binding domain and iron-sulfur cluster
MRKKVVVIGGGVAGMTAAHELIEKGFDVALYERKTRLGGKAASVNTKTTELPAEHGFRFFPGWYQHLPDTLKRIPYEVRYEKRTVYDNLVAAEKNLFASYHRDAIEALVRLPRSWEDVKTAASFLRAFPSLGLTADDLTFFFTKLLKFAATPDAIRMRDYDAITWWDFLEADDRSDAFAQYLVTGLTRNTVAAKPREASAYTIGQAVLRTLFDALRPVGLDRVLNGPTSEVWIDPWGHYLKAQGVDIVLEAELESVEFDREDKICAATFIEKGDRVHETQARLDAARLLQRLNGWDQGLSKEFLRDEFKGGPIKAPADNADAVEIARHLLTHWKREFENGRGGDVAASAERRLDAAGATRSRKKAKDGLDAYLKNQCSEARKAYEISLAERRSLRVDGDYFVFAMPVEQMAYYVNRSDTIRRVDSTIHNVIALSQQVDWMAGIQFYLTEKIGIAPGHIDCIDSEWHLTAISQTQFWPDVDMKERGKGDDVRGKVKSILSVDISAWDVKGRTHRKEAFSCTRQQIAEEVWEQLKRSLNRPNRREILSDSMLLRSVTDKKDVPTLSYSLDNDIVDRFDRAKQGLYKAQESVRFSAEAIADRTTDSDGGKALERSFVFGERLEINVEPLLINRPGSLALRPTAETKIDNMFLASDYVLTNTNITSMESANEAGRLAVNEILRRSGSQAKPCRIWQWQPSDVVESLEQLLNNRNTAEALASLAPLRLATSAAEAASGLAARALGALRGFDWPRQEKRR